MLWGKPIANLDVTLRAVGLTALSWMRGIILRNVNVVTSARPSLQTSLESESGDPLSSMQGYWITTNRTFLPESKEGGLYDSFAAPTTKDFSWELAADPLFNLKRFWQSGHPAGAPLVNNRAYFPMVVQFKRQCQQKWNANCISLSQTKKIRVPLIPVLDHPERAGTSPTERCARNAAKIETYRGALLHLETIAEVRADKELCRMSITDPVLNSAYQISTGTFVTPRRTKVGSRYKRSSNPPRTY